MFVLMPLLTQLTHFFSVALQFRVSCVTVHFTQVGGLLAFCFRSICLLCDHISDNNDILQHDKSHTHYKLVIPSLVG